MASGVYGSETSVQLILKHLQHCPECGWTTDVLLHVFCTQLQVIIGGLVHQLLHVPVDPNRTWFSCLDLVREHVSVNSLPQLLAIPTYQPVWALFALLLRLAFVLLPIFASQLLFFLQCLL